MNKINAALIPNIPTEYRTADEWKSSNVLCSHGVNKQLDSYDEGRPAAKVPEWRLRGQYGK